jgi:hypothetical protein
MEVRKNIFQKKKIVGHKSNPFAYLVYFSPNCEKCQQTLKKKQKKHVGITLKTTYLMKAIFAPLIICVLPKLNQTQINIYRKNKNKM